MGGWYVGAAGLGRAGGISHGAWCMVHHPWFGCVGCAGTRVRCFILPSLSQSPLPCAPPERPLRPRLSLSLTLVLDSEHAISPCPPHLADVVRHRLTPSCLPWLWRNRPGDACDRGLVRRVASFYRKLGHQRPYVCKQNPGFAQASAPTPAVCRLLPAPCPLSLHLPSLRLPTNAHASVSSQQQRPLAMHLSS